MQFHQTATHFSVSKAQARARAAQGHGRDNQRAMRDVGIIARVLDDAGAGEIGTNFMGREREFGSQALRQRDRNRIGKRAGQKRLERHRAAPLAQAPVVQPRLRLGSFRSS